MSTIGELERRAGIGSSPQERTTFWIQFQHLDAAECLKAGVAELNRLIAEKEATPTPVSKIATTRPKREKLPPLTEDEVQVIHAYAAKHGRRWKSVLNHVWMGGAPYDDGGTLRRLRNSHGPSWLHSYRLPKPCPDEKAASECQPDVPETRSAGQCAGLLRPAQPLQYPMPRPPLWRLRVSRIRAVALHERLPASGEGRVLRFAEGFLFNDFHCRTPRRPPFGFAAV